MAATRQLRSNFEPGTSRWATRRAQWRALGLTDEDMEKPKIAIAWSGRSPKGPCWPRPARLAMARLTVAG